VIDRLASPEVRDEILRAALRDADLDAIPDDHVMFGAFATGPLRAAVEEALGTEEAHAVTSDLSPAFAVDSHASSSGVRRRTKRASLAAPSEGAPFVLVGSADPKTVDTLVERVKQRAKVIAAYDVYSVLSAATQGSGGAHFTVLLDGSMPGLRNSSLAALRRALPSGADVITWGTQLEVEPDHASGVEWIALREVHDLAEIADLCIARFPAPNLARRVMVVHPDATWRARVTRLLTEAGYSPMSAPDSFFALDRVLADPPAAIVAAYDMEGLDGPQLASLVQDGLGEEAPPLLLVATGSLPEPPPGAVAVILAQGIEDDLLPELAVWIGSG
jgi:CheY-like chemotaxis protein